MSEVPVRTKPKYLFTLVVSDCSANIQTTFNTPLFLQANRNYEFAIVNLETYYSFANIRESDINSFNHLMLMMARLGQLSTSLQDALN